jgi:hypothetical protein
MALTPKVCVVAGRFVGAKAMVEFAYGCGDVDPAGLTFFPIMSLTSKSNSDSINTTGTRTDSDAGAYTPTIVTGVEGTFQFDGIVDVTDSNVMTLRLQLKVNNNANQGLYGYVRVTEPVGGITETQYCLINSFDTNYDTESESTFSMSLTKQNSSFNTAIITP